MSKQKTGEAFNIQDVSTTLQTISEIESDRSDIES